MQPLRSAFLLMSASLYIFLSAFQSEASFIMIQSNDILGTPHVHNSILNSSNGLFSLDWVSSSDDKYILSVVYLPGSVGAPQVWVANRNRPVSQMATLKLESEGKLVLLEANGDVVWRSNSTNARKLALMDSGNLVLMDGAANTVWESFNHPSDIMLQGQVIHTGTRIVSSTSYSNLSEGIYSVVIEAGGLIMFVQHDGLSLPYHVVGFSATDSQNTVYSVQNPSYCKGTSFTFPYGGAVVTFKQEDATKIHECNKSFDVQIGSNGSTTDLKFLRLDPDGNFRTYLYRLHYGWGVDEAVFSGSMTCILPNHCGSIGLCSSYGACSCPNNGLADDQDSFIMVKPSDPTSGCQPSEEATCNSGSSNRFVQLTGVDYFANDFLSQNTSSLEECKRICDMNCSCNAAFYRQKTRNCYHYESVMSLQQVSDQSFIALIKVGNKPISRKHISAKIVITIVFASVMAFLCVSSLIILWIRFRRKAIEKSEEDAFLKTLPGLPLRFSFRQLSQATGGFRKMIGSGGFGSVYEGVLCDGSKVAVKRLESLRQGNKEFHAEVAALGSISHLNLVRLRGFCAQRNHRLLVYDYMPNGSLEKWLFDSNNFLDWKKRFRIATDTARGLTFLHEESREQIIHLDIKPQNILLDKDFTAKLSDFGLCKLIDRCQSKIVTNVRGTPGYVAPEWLHGAAVTSKSDVYSFGMVLLELLSGRRNVDVMISGGVWYFPAWAVAEVERGNLIDVLDERIRGFSCEEEAEAAKRMVKTAMLCISQDPALRPSMSMVLRMLEGQAAIPAPSLQQEESSEMSTSFSASNTDCQDSSQSVVDAPCLPPSSCIVDI